MNLRDRHALWRFDGWSTEGILAANEEIVKCFRVRRCGKEFVVAKFVDGVSFGSIVVPTHKTGLMNGKHRAVFRMGHVFVDEGIDGIQTKYVKPFGTRTAWWHYVISVKEEKHKSLEFCDLRSRSAGILNRSA